MTKFDTIDHAISEIAAGRPVVVLDDEQRENEGDLIFAASKATPELVAFMIAHTSGYICVGMSSERCDRLGLPPMVAQSQDARKTAYTVTVDAAYGVTTGISATDRSRTIQVLGDSESQPSDLIRPGHVLPLRARDGGVLVRAGHTEAGSDLARLAGFVPAAALCEIVSEDDPTLIARTPELMRFAKKHNLAIITIEDLIAWRRRHETLIERKAEVSLPTEYGDFRAYGYRSLVDDSEHIALVRGNINPDSDESVLVRVHSECLTGDVFASKRCDCGSQLHSALQTIDEAGSGVLLYMRGQEGRGIGLINKLQAYALQEQGLDTVDANRELGFRVDSRDYGIGAQILYDLGVRRMRLMTNNPAKRVGLDGYGLEITETVRVPSNVTEENLRYLKTKRDRMGHILEGLDSYAD